MVNLDLRSLTVPVGVVRMLEVVLTCVAFSLAASAGHDGSSYWAWSMFTWTFCCLFTLLILVLELTRLNAAVPISWDDFTAAFAALATLMCLAASVIYPTFFACPDCYREIAATLVSLLGFAAYAGEVALTRLRPGQISGFLSTVPGLLKILETFVACIIFTSLDPARYSEFAGLQWCVAVYSLCFVCALVIILLTIARLLSYVPFPFDKAVTVYNVLASAAYLTAVVVWPLYGFKGYPRPEPCPRRCTWDGMVVVAFMTVINACVYILDTAYSIRLVFFAREE